jgi:hypothetical protein
VQEPLPARVAPDKLTLLDSAVAVMAPPPHEPVRPLGVPTTNPEGKVSVKATLVMDEPLLGFVIVKVRLVLPFTPTAAAAKDLLIVGGATTTMPADAVLPVPASFEVMAPVVFVNAPSVVAFTLTENVQEPLAASVAPERLTLDEPAVAVIVPAPHDPVSPLGVATTSAVGNVSVKPIPVADESLLGFVIANVRVVVPLSGTVDAPKDLLSVGEDAEFTVKLADAVLPAPLSVDVIAPVVFTFVPAVVALTLTENVQEALAASVAADRPTLDEPATAVIVPLAHDPVRPLGAATASPEGNVSVKATPETDAPAFGFDIVKVSVVAPFRPTVDAPKALLMVGGTATVKPAVAVLPALLSFDVTGPAVFVFVPVVVAVTLMEKVQEAVAPSVAPDKLTLDEPAVAVRVPPPQDPVRPLGVETTSPEGKLSVKPTLVSDEALGFVTVKLKLVALLRGMAGAPNDSVIVGGAVPATTLTLADAVSPMPPSVEVTFPVVLVLLPVLLPLMFTEKVQFELAGKVAPLKLMVPAPAAAPSAPPPQTPEKPFGVATTSPEGSVSLNPTPVRDVFKFVFPTVKLKVDVPLSGMLIGLKVLEIVGKATMVVLASERSRAPTLPQLTALIAMWYGDPLMAAAPVPAPYSRCAAI